MVAIAAITNVMIYYFEYRTLVLDGGVPASEVVDFPKYMDVYLTNQEIRMGRGGHATAPIGEFGYWLAVIDFVGFLAGGVCIYFWLLSSKFCKACEKYYRKRAERTRYFGSTYSASDYYDGLFNHYVDSDEFSHQARIGAAKTVSGPSQIMIKTTLLGCPSCKGQLWRDEVSSWNGKEWKSQDKLARLITIPEGLDMTDVVKGPETFPVLADPGDAEAEPA
jgi:hypothetical protein